MLALCTFLVGCSFAVVGPDARKPDGGCAVCTTSAAPHVVLDSLDIAVAIPSAVLGWAIAATASTLSCRPNPSTDVVATARRGHDLASTLPRRSSSAGANSAARVAYPVWAPGSSVVAWPSLLARFADSSYSG